MRVRKRVTLMVVTLSVIFAVCWGTDIIIYALKSSGLVTRAIANMMVLFNAAVNPFVYALLSQQFREKMKGIVCCTGSFASRVPRMREPHSVEPASLNTYPLLPIGSFSRVERSLVVRQELNNTRLYDNSAR